MNRWFGEAYFRSNFVADRVDGYSGYELLREHDDKETCIGRVLFWDACGQFFVETLGADVPLEILEELIMEAKASIPSA